MAAPPALCGPGSQQAASRILGGLLGGCYPPGHTRRPSHILGGSPVPPGDGRATFISSNASAVIKGKITEYSTPPGTVQFFDQSGVTSGTSGTSFTLTAGGANTCPGGLGTAFFAAHLSSPSGQSWTAAASWTCDGTVSNLADVFSMYYRAGLPAGTTGVIGTINLGASTLMSWAAGLATYYASNPRL